MESEATPASMAQRSMWAAAVRCRTPALNRFILRWVLDGPLDTQALQDALQLLWTRHPNLRSVLSLRGTQLVSIARPPDKAPVRWIEVAGSDMTGRMESALESGRVQSRSDVALSLGPNACAEVAVLGPQLHLLSIVVHHAFCDGWSAQVMADDLAALYSARARRGEACLLPQIEHPSVFTLEQSEAVRRGGYAEEVEYWRQRLQGLPANALSLSRKPKGSAKREIWSTATSEVLPLRVLTALRSRAQSLRVTLFCLLATSLAAQLSALSGATDFVLGVSALNRWSESALRVVGSFTNLLPLRVTLNAGMTWSALAKEIHASMRALIAYGRVPLEVLQQQLKEDSAAAGLSMPIWCQYREMAPVLRPLGTEITITPMPIERPALSCELEIDWLGMSGGLRTEWAFRNTLFDAREVERWQRACIGKLAAIAHGDDCAVVELP